MRACVCFFFSLSLSLTLRLTLSHTHAHRYSANGTHLGKRKVGREGEGEDHDSDDDDIDVTDAAGLMGTIYSLQARMRVVTRDSTGAAEFTLKRIRALQSGTSEWKSDRATFGRLARALEDLMRLRLAACGAACDDESGTKALRASAFKDLSSARLMVRGVVKQCFDCLGDDKRYEKLQKALDGVEEEVARLRDVVKEERD